MKKYFVLLFVIITMMGLASCFGDKPPKEEKAVPLNVCVTYQGKAYISYKQEKPYEAPDGKTYKDGDLLAAWVEYGKLTNVEFTDVTPTGGKKEADILKEAELDNFKMADIYNGKVSDLNNYGIQNKFIALDQYWDKMPDLKAFLDENPSLMLSLQASDGHVYYAPYFDGMDEVERSFYLRYDWVEKLLDNNPTYDTGKVINTVYQPFYPNGINATIKGTTKNITKNYNSDQNIIKVQNELSVKNGETLTTSLKEYIQTVYGDQYEKPSQLFLAGDAAYDADELIALMRCVKANPELLTGSSTTEIQVFIPRDNGSSRTTFMNAFTSIWGVRGVNGDNVLFIDYNGELQDGSTSEEGFRGLQMMNQLYQEGLILENYDTKAGEVTDWRGVYMYTNGTAFMTFDYNQSTTSLYEAKKVADKQHIHALNGLKIRAVLPAVADWEDGVENNYIHYSQFSRAIKTEGWGISANIKNNKEKLEAALKVVNFPYTKEGEVLVTWGPDAWIDGEMEYVSTKGIEMIPRISERARNEINTLTAGNLTNYYRYYVGSTFAIGHVRHMGFEYQILNEDGLWSASMINNAIASNAMLLTTSTYSEERGFFLLTPPTTWWLNVDEITANAAEASQATNIYTDNKHLFIMGGAGNNFKGKDVPDWEQYNQKLTEANYFSIWLANHKAAWNRMKLSMK